MQQYGGQEALVLQGKLGSGQADHDDGCSLTFAEAQKAGTVQKDGYDQLLGARDCM